MAGKVAGVGQVGAGLVTPPMECFTAAIDGSPPVSPERRREPTSDSPGEPGVGSRCEPVLVVAGGAALLGEHRRKLAGAARARSPSELWIAITDIVVAVGEVEQGPRTVAATATPGRSRPTRSWCVLDSR